MDTKKEPNEDLKWIMLACPACGKKIKLPEEKSATAKFKCPACSEVVNLKVADEEKVKPSPLDPNAGLISQANPVVEEENDNAAKERFLGSFKSTTEGLHLKDADVSAETVEKDVVAGI